VNLPKHDKSTPSRLVSGLTLSSLVAGVFCTLLLAIIVQFGEIVLNAGFLAEHSIPLPVIWVFLLLLVVTGVVKGVSRIAMLNRAERLCILYAMLIATPLMTQGFWHRIIAIIATNPRAGDFEKIDAFNDKLWPHGPNVVAGFFDEARKSDLIFKGTHTWEAIEYDKDQTATLPVLNNASADGESAVRIKLPLKPAGSEPVLIRGEPHIVSVLVRPTGLGAQSAYFCRLYADDTPNFTEVFSSSAPQKVTFLHQTGFQRVGAYGPKLPAEAREFVYLEFGLKGPGKLELFDPKIFSVAALEGIYKGRLIVSQTEYDAMAALPEAERETERAGLIVKPDNMLSLAGAKFVLSGYIPIGDWVVPFAAWTSFVLLILLGTLAIAAIMRRQWMENERYSLPMARVPEALADPDGSGEGNQKSIWRSSLLWSGLLIGFFYVVWRAAAFYNSSLPDPTIRFRLSEYISDPSWGGMFNTRFEVNLIFLSLCVFMELNVLFSLVVGYWIFMSLRWVGEFTRWNVNPAYPYSYEQTMVAYLTYGLLVLFLARRYIFRVLQAAVSNDRKFSEGEPMSYRSSVLTLLGSFVGCAVWAWWMGIGIPGMLLFFAYLMLVGFVSAKFRAEAGFAWGYFTPGNFALMMTLFGGIPLFGPSAVLFCYVASFFLGPTVFFLIPGAQVELLEVGRRWNVKGRHLVTVVVLGVLAGMLMGGWVFLSNAYAKGGESFRYGWAFDTKVWYFFSYNAQLQSATNHMAGTGAAAAPTGTDPVNYAYAFAAIGTILVTVLRQLFAGFPLHPIGFVLGTTAGTGGLLEYIWGSALAAWAIRGTVLWLGGAAVVRQKLQPFFIGIFIGACLADLANGLYGMHLRSLGLEQIFQAVIP